MLLPGNQSRSLGRRAARRRERAEHTGATPENFVHLLTSAVGPLQKPLRALTNSAYGAIADMLACCLNVSV
jgi:hypothetical protein